MTIQSDMDVSSEPELLGKNTISDANEGRIGRVAPRDLLIRRLAYVGLPILVFAGTIGAGYLKWRCETLRVEQRAAAESVAVAKEGVIALLSYRPDTVDKDLRSARDRLTGSFRDAYTSLINDVVIPGAKQKKITTAATVPAAASVSANATHAVAVVYVDQTMTMGSDAPTDTASTVRVGLDKVDGRWLISAFDPV